MLCSLPAFTHPCLSALSLSLPLKQEPFPVLLAFAQRFPPLHCSFQSRSPPKSTPRPQCRPTPSPTLPPALGPQLFIYSLPPGMSALQGGSGCLPHCPSPMDHTCSTCTVPPHYHLPSQEGRGWALCREAGAQSPAQALPPCAHTPASSEAEVPGPQLQEVTEVEPGVARTGDQGGTSSPPQPHPGGRSSRNDRNLEVPPMSPPSSPAEESPALRPIPTPVLQDLSGLNSPSGALHTCPHLK